MRWLILTPILAMVLAACAAAGSGSSPSCEPLQPGELLSGSPPGQPMRSADGRLEWGSGRDRLVEAVGELAVTRRTAGRMALPDGDWTHVLIRGAPGVVIPVGDPGVGEVAIEWLSGSCAYTIWLAPGATIDETAAYARRF